VSATFFEGKDVVNFFGRGKPFVLFTFLTQRVLLDVLVSDTPPSRPITLATVIRTFVFVVSSVHHPGVLLAITSVGELGATGKATRFLGFRRHWVASFPGIVKAPQEGGSYEALYILVCHYNYTIRQQSLQLSLTILDYT
jgi:hypothetical protein